MNRKKIFTVFVAVGIAGILIILPYQSNALTGVELGTAFYNIKYLIDKWFKKSDIDTTDDAYTQSVGNYYNAMVSAVNRWNRAYAKCDANVHNLYELYNNTFLYHSRNAEIKVLDYLNYTDWSKCSKYVIEEFDNISFEFLKTILSMYNEIDLDASQELEYANKNIEFCNITDNSAISMDGVYTIGIKDEGNYVANTTYWCYMNWLYYDSGNDLIVDGKYITPNKFYLYDWDFVSWKHSEGTLVANFIAIRNLSDGLKCFDIDTNGNISAIYWNFRNPDNAQNLDLNITISIDGHDDIIFKPYTQERIKLLKSFRNVLQDMANSILKNAYIVWESYHDRGIYSKSDIPANEILPYPDLLFDNIDALRNLSLNESMYVYYSMLSQMSDTLQKMDAELTNASNDFDKLDVNDDGVLSEDEINKSVWDSYDYLKPYMYDAVTDSDSDEGKNITWDEWLDSFEDGYGFVDSQDFKITTNEVYGIGDLYYYNVTGKHTIFQNHSFLVLPLEKNITLITGKTYNITDKKPEDNTIQISQQLYIIDMNDNYTLYKLIPSSYYHLHIDNIKNAKTNTSLPYYEWKRENLDDFAYNTWGFDFNPFSDDWSIPATKGGFSWDWINGYKIWIVVGCLFIGFILRATATSSKRDSWKRILGAVLLIIGIILGIYWYIYPYVENWLSFRRWF